MAYDTYRDFDRRGGQRRKRSDTDGLWTKYDLEDVATPQGFARDPVLVHDFYNARRANCLSADPNDAHHALARLETEHPDDLLIVTQNIDNLHERAGSRRVWHMHGELLRALCAICGHRWDAPAIMTAKDPCPACKALTTRPDVVWFGEIPYLMDEIQDALYAADLFVSIGTSGTVYPAAGFVRIATAGGAQTLEINIETTGSTFDETRQGAAGKLVPAWVKEVLGEA
jgi:NAD-dependent deacetylase